MAAQNPEKSDSNKGNFSPVDPIYRIPDIIVDDEFLVERALTKFACFESDRVEWMERREDCYAGWDDYLTPVRKGLWDSASNVHLPITEIQCNVMHAKFMQAFFFIDPIFFVDPQEDMDANRVKKISLTMKYIIERGANYNEGIYNAVDDWAWDLTTDGMGIFSRDWRTEQRRFVTVEENQALKDQKKILERLLTEDINESDFKLAVADVLKKPYQEVAKIRTTFNGSIVTAEDPTFILFKGDVVDSTDLNQHETVIKVCYFTKNELLAFKYSSYMDEDAIDAILAGPADKKGSSSLSLRTNRLNYLKDDATGIKTINAANDEDRYELLCVYDTVSLSGQKFGTADKIVYFVHPRSKQLTRWTFLDRISATGKLPLHMAHLYRRPRRSIGRGMVETQYPLNDVQDILVNQVIDGGSLANNPMFAWKANSSFDPQEIRVEPGLGIKTDDPNNDIRFFNWNINPTWALPVLSLLGGYGSQLTSLGPQSTGQVGGRVGPLRSTSGLREMLGQSETQIDVLIKRAKKCMSSLFEGLYQDNVDRMPDSMMITITGQEGTPLLDDEGNPMSEKVSREELRARVHFGLYANSVNMNSIAQEENAMKMAGFLLQPVGLQTGIVKPANIWAIYDHILSTMRTPLRQRFISQPADAGAIPYEAEILMIMQGMMPPLAMADPEHQSKLERMVELADSDTAALEAQNGKISKNAIAILKKTIAARAKLIEMTQKPSNMQNPTGSNTSPTLGQQGGEAPPEQGPMDTGTDQPQ